MDYLISLFIDDELNLDEKILFVETVRSDAMVAADAVSLLHQEKRLRADVTDRLPAIRLETDKPFKKRFRDLFRPLAPVLAGMAATAAVLFAFMPTHEACPLRNRFVVYRPDALRVDIAGSFTGWKKIPMNKAGLDGYWEITLPLSEGEHRFAYIADGGRRFPDPTVPCREMDDFGTQNSILNVEKSV